MHRIRTISFRITFVAGVLLLAGCPNSPAPVAKPAAAQPAPLRLLVVDDPALAKQIVRVKGEWKARSGADLEIRELTSGELTAAQTLAADAVIYPTAELGSLAERSLIRPFAAAWLERDEFHRSELFEPGGLAELQWGQETYSVPFGSPVLVLFYRRDLFERFHLKPPTTWAAYQRLVEFFDKQQSDLPAKMSATVEPLADGWAGKMLLARAAPYAKHRDYFATLFDKETMEPQIASPPFVRALEELAAAAKPASAVSLAATPADARSAILAGECAMAISWPTAADAPAPNAPESGTVTAEPLNIGFAALPGSTEVYNPKEKSWQTQQSDEQDKGSQANPSPLALPLTPLLGISGRLGSVTKESPSGELAFQLLAWLSSGEWSVQICPSSPATTLFRRSQLNKPGRWVEPRISPAAAGEYADVVVRSLSQPQWLECPRLPGHAEYMAALDEAVRAAVAGKQTPAEALAHAADRWREITARLGVDSQRAAYNRSLGLEP